MEKSKSIIKTVYWQDGRRQVYKTRRWNIQHLNLHRYVKADGDHVITYYVPNPAYPILTSVYMQTRKINGRRFTFNNWYFADK